ncbi:MULTISPECIES: DUF1302 domain-containing protein [Hydrocarboniphaga]|uniref:DUF1302 domain-containing protein n=1 Tax=Hydrocarboniphaga TaxID=243627 RepID=UPI002ABACE35|nr:DUF1302 family protein [Hydrocarboniphaga sp.]MDZ4078769.1 DUF1302 family protein [Hydrocarboniphaga sp.]
MSKQQKSVATATGRAAAGIAFGVLAMPAEAFEFEVGGKSVRIDSLVTVGALMRTQGRDDSLVGKSSLQPGLCVSTAARNAAGEPTLFTGDACASNNAEANQRFVDAPGSYNPNGDNGNLSFDKGDVVHAATKLTTDFNTNIAGYNLFARTLLFYDPLYEDHEIRHPDTTMQPAREDFSKGGKKALGQDFRFLDYFVSKPFEAFDRDFSIKVGNHVLNWGESSFLVLNSLNSINPPDQSRLRIPGFDIKELSQPLGMVSLNGQITENTGFEVFYQYDWKPILIDPVGSFFSTSDTLGAGGTYAMLSFSKAPEDPYEYYAPNRNPQDTTGLLGSSSDRTVIRDYDEERRRRPDDGGQYGVSLKTFLENFNGGTELAFYYANYHSRIPTVSFIAADETCLSGPTGSALANFLACRATGGEPLPVGSAKLFAEYPEDIHLFGTSFNTNVGNWALSGEYAFRSNLPIQIHTTDLTFAALQPAFPTADVNLGIATIPGRRSAVPDFVQTTYRGEPVTANQYIRGYERMKVGQLGLTAINTIGGGNWLGATQILLLFETGWTHVFNMPGLDELQFQGAEVNTHISSGADGSLGINPVDVRSDPNDPSTNVSDSGTRQNPTRQRRYGFGTADSAGYRAVAQTRYDNLFLGINVEFLTAIFHDVYGVAPGLGQNFVEGRVTAIGGVRFDYLNTYNFDIRYTWYADTKLDSLRDRDNLLMFFGYQF